MSATLTKTKCLQVLDKAGVREDYQLMQISLDRPEIQQIYCFMQYAKSSLLDLQFILPPRARYTKDIQKTLIFVNTMAEVLPIVEVIRKWIGLLNYPKESEKWVCLYFSTMSDLDKVIIAEAFKVDSNINIDCIILVATDAYGMKIDNHDI